MVRWSERLPDFTVELNVEHTAELNDKARAKYGTSKPRIATHASDLFYCLRKGWQRIIDANNGVQENPSINTLWTWASGLMFEEWVSDGYDQQARMGWCPRCTLVEDIDGHAEQVHCPQCGERWVLGTPDWIDEDGVINESKQTRKSSRYGLDRAQNYVDQLRTYLMFDHIKGNTDHQDTELVGDWIMGDYGAKHGKDISHPPQSVLNAHTVTFSSGFEAPWAAELDRRKDIVEAKDMPLLNGMGDGDELCPQYDWECATCDVGLALECPSYIWDKEGMIKLEPSTDS